MDERAFALTPFVRLLLRYGAGVILGLEAGDILAGDPDVVLAAAMAMSIIAERAYAIAKRNGGPT